MSTTPNIGPATHDIAVVGAGLVGLAAALAFADAGLDVVIVGAAMAPPSDRLSGQPDLRDQPRERCPAGWAGGPGTRSRRGACSLSTRWRCSAIARAPRWGSMPSNPGCPPLAHIVESGVLSAALATRVSAHERIEVRVPARPTSLLVTDREAGPAVRGCRAGHCPSRGRCRRCAIVGASGRWLRYEGAGVSAESRRGQLSRGTPARLRRAAVVPRGRHPGAPPVA